jgi:peroxiredoxin Q/BCP
MLDLSKTYVFEQQEPRKIDVGSYEYILLYFYPKDLTSGCTVQAEALRDHHEQLEALGVKVIGVSRDSFKRHASFRKKHQLGFDLIADTESELCKQFDVLKMKSMYGRSYEGIERSTFLLDKHGAVLKEWRKVSPKAHIDLVLQSF